MRFRVLGSLEVVHDGKRVHLSGKRARALAHLLLESGSWIPAHRFADFLWDDEPPSTAVRQVQNTLASLRRLLTEHGGDPIERSGLGYRLRSEDIDLVHFERDLARAREAMRADDPAAAAELLDRALGHWRGSVLADLDGDQIAAAAARLEKERLAALEALNDAELALERGGSVVTRARELLSADPYRQRAAVQLMHALHGLGRGVEALEVYNGMRNRLSEELGLDPGAELQEAQHRVLAEVPEPAALTPKPQPAPVPAQLPATVSGFCSRDADMAALDAQLDSGTMRIAVVSGPGGVGKTSLAIEWAHRVRDRFPDGQLYVDLSGFAPDSSALAPADALGGFLTALGVSAASLPRDLDARADLYRSLLADRRMLVVLDNARDAEQVRPLLPGSPDCTVLVTSRLLLSELVVRNGASQLRLEVLDRPDARELLRRRLGRARAEAEPEVVEAILDICAGLPLALAIVAARAVVEPHFPLRAIADRLSEAESALEALENDDLVGDVRAVISWSYDALSPEAARLFRLTGLHPGPDFSAAAAASLAGIPIRRSRVLLRELTDAHLLTEHRPGRYALHDLLAVFARETVATVEGEVGRGEAERRMLSHCLGSALSVSESIEPFRRPPSSPDLEPDAEIERFGQADAAMNWVKSELRVLDNMIAFAERTGADAYTTALAWAVAGALHRNGDWGVGLGTQRRALRAARRLGDRRHKATAHMHISMFLFSSGEFDEAERHLGQALDCCDPERDRTVLAQVNHQLAVLLNEVGRFGEALDHCMEAYRLFQDCGDEPGQAGALNGIGWLQAKLGRYGEAIEHCRKSLALSESIGAHSTRAQALDSLGYALNEQGRHREAIECYQQSVEVNRLVGSRLNEAQSRVHLGESHQAMGEAELAREQWLRALSIFEEVREHRADQVRARLAELESPEPEATADGGVRP